MIEKKISSALIDIQQASYSYTLPSAGKSKVLQIQALSEIDLQIQQGEYVVLLGHNGSGKSTLARLCNALLVPEKGCVLVAGQDTHVEEYWRTIRNTVGMIFQNPDNQIIATVVGDDVAWGLTMQGIAREEIYERVEAALQSVGIAHLRHQFPHRLSGGERQRLAIAGILALRPRCIIADEATSMLDPFTRQEITRLLHQLHEEYNLTIIQVTHLLEEAVEAQRVIVMERGQIVVDGKPAQIFADLERLRQLHLSFPDPIVLASHLRKAGMSIAPDALTNGAIAQEIAHQSRTRRMEKGCE